MAIKDLADLLPDYAEDLKKNIARVPDDETLSEEQRYGTMLVAALASFHPEVIRVVEADAAEKLSPQAMHDARVAHAAMAMNNVYYKFVHFANEELYRPLPMKIRKTNLGALKSDPIAVEMWSLAVSAINGCDLCVRSHEVRLREAGIEPEVIAACARIAAVVYGVACVIKAEEAAKSG